LWDSEVDEIVVVEPGRAYRAGLWEYSIAVVLAAAADAQCQLDSFQIRTSRYSGIIDVAFYIPPSMEGTMTPLLMGLKELKVSLAFLRHHHGNRATLGTPCFCRFLSMARNVEVLRLSFACADDPCAGFLEWLGLEPDPDQPVTTEDAGDQEHPPCHLPRLRLLELRNANPQFDPEVLRSVVSKFSPTLRSLNLNGVGLLTQPGVAASGVSIWKPLLQFIARSCDLTEWHLYQLTELLLSRTASGVDGKRYGRAGWPTNVWKKHYVGRDASEMLADAADELLLTWQDD
jgi:hypothetical protein